MNSELKTAIEVEFESLNYWATKRAEILGPVRLASFKAQLDTAMRNILDAATTPTPGASDE